MGFHGLASVGEYEAAARSHGLRTRRIPFHRGRESFFALVTESAKSRPGAVKIWTLMTADESREIMSGVIDGQYSSYIGKLTKAGYYPG